METRSIVAEMFIGIPTHFWVLPAAGVIAYFGLKWADRSLTRSTLLRTLTYLLLLALAVLPNGIHALFPPTPELLVTGQSLPNYKGLFYLDTFYVFAGWALSRVAKLKFR